MAHFDPTVCMTIVLLVGGIGLPRLAARHMRVRLLFAVTVVSIWVAFVLNMLWSGDPHATTLFGDFDEHQILSEGQRLHLITLSVNYKFSMLLAFVSITIVWYSVVDDRLLGGQVSARLRTTGQLPQNWVAFLFSGASGTPHGPPSSAFAMSLARV